MKHLPPEQPGQRNPFNPRKVACARYIRFDCKRFRMPIVSCCYLRIVIYSYNPVRVTATWLLADVCERKQPSCYLTCINRGTIPYTTCAIHVRVLQGTTVIIKKNGKEESTTLFLCLLLLFGDCLDLPFKSSCGLVETFH